MDTIIDTNVILNDAEVLLEFNDLVIPYFILEELDNKKRDKEVGFQARKATRIILNKNIKCIDIRCSADKVDDKLIRLGQKGYKILTEDLLLYLKGKTSNSNVKLYKMNNDLYEGVIEYNLSSKVVDELYNKGKVKTNLDLYENQFIDSGNVIARYKGGYLYKVNWNGRLIDGSKMNRRQNMLNNLLYDQAITVVAYGGEKGTGKTTLAIESALNQLEKGIYNKCILIRPQVQQGGKWEEMGWLPGEKEDKLDPFMNPFWDNLKNKTQFLENFEIESIGYLQGRNIENSLIIVTEFENVHPNLTEGIIDRVAKGSKIILEGDIYKTQRYDLNSKFNGLTHVINTLKDEKLVGSIVLDKIERSETAKMAKKLRLHH